MNLEAPAGNPKWKLVNSPLQPDCVPEESAVPVLETEAGIRFVRTPVERFREPSWLFFCATLCCHRRITHALRGGRPS